MGALKSNASYLRFLVDGDVPKNFATKYEKSIEARRFAADNQGESEAAGWVPLEEPMDDELPITRERFVFGRLIGIAYREDRVSIPRALIIHETKKRVDQLSESGKKVGRAHKRDIQLAITAELKARALPRPRVMELVWDLDKREVRIFGGGPMAKDRCTALFERSFSFKLHLQSYAARAFSREMSKRARNLLENLAPIELSTSSQVERR